MADSKETSPYSAFGVYRVCFACGRAEKVDIQAEGTPLMVKDCESCGARMYMLQGVEAYFDRFFGDQAISDDVLSTLTYSDVPALPEGEFEISLMDSKYRFRAEDKAFVGRFKRCLEVSKRHALKMLRNESELLTKEWPSSILGTFRVKGELADSVLESLFVRGRFTLEDAKAFDAEFGVDDQRKPYISTEGNTYYLDIKEGMESWFEKAFTEVGTDKGRQAACVSTACILGLENTVAADIDPGYVVKDEDLKDAAELIALKTKAAFGDTCSMEITDDGKLVISAESKSADRLVKALASAGVSIPDTVADGVVLVSAKRSISPALFEELKQTSSTSLDSELKKGVSDVLGALAQAIQKRKEGDFATVDDVKTVQYTDVVAAVKELCSKGYLTPVVEGWAYALTEEGKRLVAYNESRFILEQDEVMEFEAAFNELINKYDEYKQKWVEKFGSDEGYDAWFTGQVFGEDSQIHRATLSIREG